MTLVAEGGDKVGGNGGVFASSGSTVILEDTLNSVMGSSKRKDMGDMKLELQAKG